LKDSGELVVGGQPLSLINRTLFSECPSIHPFLEFLLRADFTNPPSKGDWVTAWGAQYVVTTLRQPDAYGMIALILLQRS
jgi:hypothetical protein